MDFKKLISHIESIDGPIDTPKAQEKAQPIRLDEDTELRVLAGVTPLTESLIAERAKNPYAIGMAAAMKQADDKPPLKKSTIKKGHEIAKSIEKEAIDVKTIQAAQSHSAANPSTKDSQSDANVKKPYGYRGPDGSEADDEVTKAKAKAKAKKESVDTEAFKNKFSKMVEAAKPDFLDIDKDGDKKEPMKKAAQEAGKGKKPADKKGMSAKQAKYFGKKNESVKATKKVVAESVEQPMSFREMMKLVVESGGQQQMDPLDATLFDWASRIAKNKLGEGMKAEIYAGLVYERMGGRFEMYDVLSENKNKK